MKPARITIIGGGNGAFAAAGHLTLVGHQVTLFEMPAFQASLDPIKKRGGKLKVKCLPSNHLPEGEAMLHKLTIDAREAMEESDIILVITPAQGHESIAKAIAPYVRSNHVIAITPGNFGGSIKFRNYLIAGGCEESVKVAEFETMPYATRKEKDENGEIVGPWIRGYKHGLGCSVFPSKNSDEIFNRLYDIYDILEKRDNVLVTGVSNVNTYGHPPCMVGSIQYIDKKEKPLMNEIKTESIAHIRKELDLEHMQLKNIGINVVSAREITKSYYGYQNVSEGGKIDDLDPDDVWRHNKIYVDSKLPDDWNHRYLTEDIPFGLVPLEELLEQYALPHPITTACINFADLLCGKNFREEGAKLADCGLKGLTLSQLHQYLENGTY